MGHTLKLTTVGNSTGVIFPKELLEKMRLSKGDIVQVFETPNGIELQPFDSELAMQMDVAEKIMRKRRNLLRKLAE